MLFSRLQSHYEGSFSIGILCHSDYPSRHLSDKLLIIPCCKNSSPWAAEVHWVSKESCLTNYNVSPKLARSFNHPKNRWIHSNNKQGFAVVDNFANLSNVLLDQSKEVGHLNVNSRSILSALFEFLQIKLAFLIPVHINYLHSCPSDIRLKNPLLLWA